MGGSFVSGNRTLGGLCGGSYLGECLVLNWFLFGFATLASPLDKYYPDVSLRYM